MARGGVVSVESLSESVREAREVRWMSPHPFRRPGDQNVSLAGLVGIAAHSPADQVVVVRGGTTLDQLNQELSPFGQVIPYGIHPAEPIPLAKMTVADAICLNLPHANEATTGTWRDWILGMRLMLVSGEIVKTGSLAVKSVAGYDIHRFLVGSRGTLAIPVEIFLRTTPAAAIRPAPLLEGTKSGDAIRRTQLTDVRPTTAEACEPTTGTHWGVDPNVPLSPHAWQLVPGEGKLPERSRQWFIRAKKALDPARKLQPEEWEGI